MNYSERRQRVEETMEQGSILLLYSGEELHISADTYFDFEANRQFFYLTGIRRENMALLIDKCGETVEEHLFIEPIDPSVERWVGKKMTKEEATAVSGIEKIHLIEELPSVLSSVMARKLPKKAYFDLYRHQSGDLPDYNAVKAKQFAAEYPAVTLDDIYPAVAELRMVKDAGEVEKTRKAVEITKEALRHVMATLCPEQKEYQVQAEFEYKIKMLGAESPAFPTIAGSGANGTMLHYETNRDTCKADTLILLDLGARYEGYNSDITRTYPVSGTFTARQKQIYDIVLAANREVASMAKPGVTLRELNERCKEVLSEGLLKLGLIEKPEEISKYYMHGVSHHLGIDVHDVTVPKLAKLQPGMIITDEPGLYIDEEEIGIRIEDDLLITENGCEVLSADIVRTTEEIERNMRER
ncbi:MAG: aminopeptidase P family protein [Lachnospiraceae bacterium]